MKRINIFIYLPILMFATVACDPIEDKSLREDYFENVGDPIGQEELEAAISVTQPIPNSDDKVEGDQYVVIKNNRPDIGGVWHIETSIGVDKTLSDNDTIVYTSNGTYSIYFAAMSANKYVKTSARSVTVTNCFDEWETILTGATSKVDKTAKKTWEFWASPSKNVVYFNGMYGNWKYFPLAEIHEAKNSWDGGGTTLDKAGNYTMEFQFDGNKLVTYKPDGSILKQGAYSFVKTAPTDGIIGQLITTVPIIGSETSWAGTGASNTYWLMQIDEKNIAIAHPQSTWNSGGADWDYSAWYGFYKAKE